jgi:hypothetical protein
MPEYVILLSVPGLRAEDIGRMPNLQRLTAGGDRAALVPSFPAVTCPVQANMTTGVSPSEHGVVANGFFWRESDQVEMWTSPNDCILAPQIWDRLHEHDSAITSAVWFPLHSKECKADYVCTPAPVHNPDGSESLWCYTKPLSLYGDLLDELGHFPLQHFWGPLANIKATAWIAASAVHAAREFRPNFFYIYLPHLDYAAQKSGPNSDAALGALTELDGEIAKLASGFAEAYGAMRLLWLVASEYTIVPVDHVVYPNRLLREAELLLVRDDDGREQLDVVASPAWALADHQFSHVFVRERDAETIRKVVELFRGVEGVAEVLTADELGRYELNHDRAGDVVLVSAPNSWQAYYWWTDDARAPAYARTVDIHRKPGYDPAEMFFEPATKGIPLDATLVKGSHGAPAKDARQRGVLLSSERGVFVERPTADVDLAELVLRQFGV